MLRKFNLYLKAGVREYWVIAPEAQAAQVFIYQDGKYLGASYATGDSVSSVVLEGLSIKLAEVFAG
jgi:Uma2 family endonuclease